MQLQVELPPQLEPVYSNIAFIQHSPSEFIVDFARLLPGVPTAKVGARVVTTPMHARLLLRALEENIQKYEAQFGCRTTLPKIIRQGYNALNLINFFTCGADEVRAWTIRRGYLAPQAAG